MSEKKKTIVLGASLNPERYSYLAIHRLRRHHHPVVAIGKKNGQVSDIQIQKEKVPEQDIDTVTLYLNAKNQEPFIEYILSLHPKRIIFNPGSENDKLVELARKNNIEPVIACTLVLLSTGQY
ncbi:MAG: CoA-binding protein [Flavisolibacter sp.]